MPTYVVRVARQATVFLLFMLTIVLGAVSGVLFAFAGDLPQISALDDYAPSTITRIYANNGDVIGEFAKERRLVVTYDGISPLLRQAIVAAEDKDFEEHVGLSVPRIVITAFKDVVHKQRAGASTITQQLARMLFLQADYMKGGVYARTGVAGWERKVKEAIISVQLEKRFTKREILTLYCNTTYFGHGAYGVEAASRLYFGKAARDLALEEAALIAGIIQGNVRQSPYINPDAAARRRNYALQRMAEEGFITAQQAAEAKGKPIKTAGLPRQAYAQAQYFVEEVRQQLEQRFGAKQLYENGLSVQTSLDLPLQQAATRALQAGLRRLDQRRGFRKPSNLLTAGADLDAYRHPRWQAPMVVGDVIPAVVTGTTPGEIQARAGRLDVRILKAGYEWTGKANAGALVSRGDLVQVLIGELDGHTATGGLAQDPELQGGVVALDNPTGRILAMVGGFDFDRSKFNRAIQASRQLGSTFKLVVYTAAIDRGYTPASTLLDSPVSFPGGAGSPPYAPLNYDRQFEGPISLRRALEQSRNVPTVRLMNALGPKQVVQYAKKLGITSTIPPYLSSALGAGEATLLEITNAFSLFPNQGVRMTPYQIVRVTDREGNALEENRPAPSEAIRADTAFVMTTLLRGVVQHGTATRAAVLDWPLGGKTGTTDDFTDAWFVGFDPDITIGVWVGFDTKRPIGQGQSGAVAALPIWIDVMQHWVDRQRKAGKAPPDFPAPGNIIFATNEAGQQEAFIAGTEPGAEIR
ncbi:Penicillin-binding protein 1A [Luteitalea pratensis]|uniref:Penicillin-binding protein 1A n=1 Tax=Luteitalea pratensis TaxID=1855912 RepID=A0A143PT22_LUTPR|nr:PBP1A family penicillin-binding protein [Luteitalea pratensis]AMY11230.1 Penicillin-binding protein 1A [Luteitalea pratensis]